jgi:hypothetical protein
MMILPSPIASSILKVTCHTMSNVDSASSFLLKSNEYAVNFALDHNAPLLAKGSLFLVQNFDHIGTIIISFSLWLVSQIM